METSHVPRNLDRPRVAPTWPQPWPLPASSRESDSCAVVHRGRHPRIVTTPLAPPPGYDAFGRGVGLPPDVTPLRKTSKQ